MLSYEVYGRSVDWLELTVTGLAALFSIMLVTTILAITVLVAVRILFGRKGRAVANADEARVMQEIYVGLEKLNDRVESIETIVLDDREERTTV